MASLAALSAWPSTAQPVRAAQALAGEAPVRQTFGSWILVCDNVRVCRAQPSSSSGSLMIRRDPGPAGQLLVVLDGQEPTLGPSLPDAGTIALDGEATDRRLPWRVDHEGERAQLGGDAALRFVRAIADGAALTYRASGETLEVPLAGLKAALLAMDDRQGRVGTPTAFTRPGERSLAGVPAAIGLPVVQSAPPPSAEPLPDSFVRQVRRASGRWLEACTEERADVDEAYPLSDGEAIAMFACGTGTHSTSYVLVRASRTAQPRVQRLILPPVPRPGEELYEEDSYTDVEWDPATSSIHASGYACAHTCGENSRWVFDGRAFVLAEHFVYESGGAEPLYLYRTEIRPGR